MGYSQQEQIVDQDTRKYLESKGFTKRDNRHYQNEPRKLIEWPAWGKKLKGGSGHPYGVGFYSLAVKGNSVYRVTHYNDNSMKKKKVGGFSNLAELDEIISTQLEMGEEEEQERRKKIANRKIGKQLTNAIGEVELLRELAEAAEKPNLKTACDSALFALNCHK